jgi:hypothetical protein
VEQRSRDADRDPDRRREEEEAELRWTATRHRMSGIAPRRRMLVFVGHRSPERETPHREHDDQQSQRDDEGHHRS